MNYKNGRSIVIDGNSFISIKEACDYYDLDYDKVRSRLNNGWTIEEAFEFVERDDSCRSVNLEGKHFNSIKEACKYYNLEYNTVYDRLNRGWSVEEAFELVPRQKKKK